MRAEGSVIISGLTVGVLALCLGCMPEAKAPVVEGPIDMNTASQLQSKIRREQGDKYSVEHQLDGKTFTANWELGNALKKTSQLQIKPPADWSDTDVYQALEVVLAAPETKPWYGQIDETVLDLTREAMRADNGLASNLAPETPYDVQVKVKQHSTEWFLEVKVRILNEEGDFVGF